MDRQQAIERQAAMRARIAARKALIADRRIRERDRARDERILDGDGLRHCRLAEPLILRMASGTPVYDYILADSLRWVPELVVLSACLTHW